MQTSWTSQYTDQVDSAPWDHAHRAQVPINLQTPTRPAPSPSPSQFPAPEPTRTHRSEGSRSRLPRTSSLLPPPHISPNSSNSYDPRSASSYNRPSVGAPSAFTESSPEGRTDRDKAPFISTSRSPNTFVNRWSASTGSSRSNYSVSRNDNRGHNRQASSVDTSFLQTSSPPSAKRVSRKLHKSRPSNQSEYRSSVVRINSPVGSESRQAPYVGLPALDPLSLLSQDYTTAWRDHQTSLEESTPQLQSDFTKSTSPSNSAADRPGKMPYHQLQESRGGQGHSRQRSGKGSADSSSKSKSTKPSQKATLSRALQKANHAVQLDNTSDTAGARQAYAEACELLQQVLQRTSAPEDKQKLEAIRLTYTSRIDELDQMLPWNGHASKALPDYPDQQGHYPEESHRFDHEGQDDFETATMTTVVGHDTQDNYATAPPTHPWQHDNPSGRGSPSRLGASPMALQNPEPGFLQSSFNRSPIRSRFPDNAMQLPSGPSGQPAHVSTTAQNHQKRNYSADLDGPIRSDFSVSSESRSGSRRGLDHAREDSQNSWLDPIDESGGSTASSVHSRTSSLGYRRRHIRSGSGDTEAEFDTALDAAIEAAYDDGYEPMEDADGRQTDSEDDVVANALRRVELARQRVRQTEREAYEMANEHERERFQLQPQQHPSGGQADVFFDDNSSEEEERMLEEMTRDDGAHDLSSRMQQHGKQRPVPRESDSSGFTSRTWQSSIASNPPGTGTTSLSTVAETISEKPPMPPPKGPAPLAPAAPPPTHALPDIPAPALSTSAETVRNRRLSGQNLKQLRIETSKLAPPPPPSGLDDSSQPRSTPLSELRSADPMDDVMRPATAPRRPSSPPTEPSPMDMRPLGSPFGHRMGGDGQDNAMDRSVSPGMSKLKKNFSSSSLRSLKSRNMSVSNIDEGAESPGTPSSSQWNSSRPPAIPAIPNNVAANLYRTETTTGGMHLIDDGFHCAETPGTPNPNLTDAPVPLEPCPTDFMLRPFWLMRCLFQTLVHPRGGYVSTKLFVPREAWKVKGVKLKNLEDKIANCDYLTAALLKLARVDTFDADAMLEEMQSMEGVLEQTQAALSRRLGNEVGTQNVGNLFKDAASGADGDSSSGVPRSASVSGKSSFSWRRLRSKNSAAALGTQGRAAAVDSSKDAQPISTLPMTGMPTSKPAKRDMSTTQFTGPYAQYMGSLARLFDAAQVIDQIARQVEDPGLKHADKTQVGLELCTRHAAEFFAFYICRFVLADVGLLMDKFIKRGSEWVLT